MAQSYDVSGSQGGGRSFARRPIVLARLPHVGTTTRTIPMAQPEKQAPTFAEATRFYVDPHHATPVAQADGADRHESQRGTTEAGRRHHPHRRPTQPPQPMLAASLPVRLASYSGLFTTVILAASVALLYWMIVVPQHTPTADFSNSLDALGATQIEIPYFEVAAPPPSPPPASVPAQTIDPLVDEAPELAQETLSPAPPAAEVVEEAAPTLTAATTPAENQAAAETPAPVEPATDLAPLPEIIPAPAVTPQVIYNDASAAVYPTSAHPQALDFTAIRIANVRRATDPAGAGARLFSAPQVARQPESNQLR